MKKLILWTCLIFCTSCVNSYPGHGRFYAFENGSIRDRYQACLTGIALYQVRHHENLFSDDSLDAEKMRINICSEIIQRDAEILNEEEKRA